MKIPLMNKHRKRDKKPSKTWNIIHIQGTWIVCLGKQTAFNVPLEWSYSQVGKRELQGNFTAILNKFLKHFKKITVIY